MDNSPLDDELFSEIDTERSFTQRYLGLSLAKFLTLVLLVMAVGIYIGILLFGDNSLEVLLQIESHEEHLKDEIGRLKQENADLQKEYFELELIDSDE